MALFFGTLCAHAQIAGEFVVPDIRMQGETDFAYWDLFTSGEDGKNYDFNNEPGLLSGTDSAGNVGNLTEGLTFKQTGSPNAFITSSGAIYDFGAPTAFEVELVPAEGEPFTNVIFQTMTGGQGLNLDNIWLDYESPEGESVSLNPNYKGLDNPATGQFAERVISAFQWDLTGLGAASFLIRFASPGSSLAIWESQLDAVQGGEFTQELGYLLFADSLPRLRNGSPGQLIKDLSDTTEQRFHLPSDTFDVLAEPEPGFEHVGWIYQGMVSETEALTITFEEDDLDVTTIFAPLLYEDWRRHVFFEANPLLGQEADNLDDTISGPDVDPDGDGLTNLEEYAFGTDPYIQDSVNALPQIQLVEVGGTTVLELSYYRQAALDEESDLLIEILSSEDLLAWEQRDTFTLFSNQLMANGLREMIYHCPLETMSSFHQLQVSLVE